MYIIVSGNKTSSVDLHQNHAMIFIEMLKQMQKFYFKPQNAKNQVRLVLKSPQFKTIYIKLISEHIEYALLSFVIDNFTFFVVALVKRWMDCD